MEKEENKRSLIVLVIVLFILVLGLGGYIAYDKFLSDNSTNLNNNAQAPIVDNNTIESLIDSVKITNFNFGKPEVSAFGGGTNNTISINTNFNLKCLNDAGIAGVTLKGYCTDKNNKKYSIVGPLSVMAFYCDNNSSHTDTGIMYVNQIFDENGVPHDIDWANANNIKWEEIEIKYCKVEKANIRLSDGSDIVTNIEFSYEKYFK